MSDVGSPEHPDHRAETEAIYDRIAQRYEDFAEGNFYNALMDRPAVLDLCGDVSGLNVFDAGCGPGLYATELLDRGAASVTGIDLSAEMVSRAETRCLGRPARFYRHDLGSSLSGEPDGNYDLIVCPLVIHYLAEPEGALRELRRIVAPDGACVVSTGHPTGEWLASGGSYFDQGWTRLPWKWPGGAFDVGAYRFTVQQLADAMAGAGWLIERIVEPLPPPAAATDWPDQFDKAVTTPTFITFRLLPRR